MENSSPLLSLSSGGAIFASKSSRIRKNSIRLESHKESMIDQRLGGRERDRAKRGFNDAELGFCEPIQADLSVRKSRKVACYIYSGAREPSLYNGAVGSEIARALRG